MAKTLLKVAGGINLAFGGLILLLSMLLVKSSFLSGLGIIALGIAVIWLTVGGVFLYVSQKNNDNFIKSRDTVLGLSIVSILMGNVINFILGIVAYTDMQSKSNSIEQQPIVKRELTEEEKTQKRLRNLLALGCGLVLLSGIIFAVTTWETLSGIGKTISLIIATVVFFLMSTLAEKKFKLKTSAITYYILANAFMIFALVSAGYFELFGSWFSLNGEAANLYIGFLWLLGSVLSYLAYLKYDIKDIFYVISFTTLLGLVYTLSFFNIGKDIILFVVLTILAIFSLIPRKGEIINRVNDFSKIFLPIVSLVLLINIASLDSLDGVLFSLLAFGVAFISMYYLAVVNKDIFYEIFAPIFTILAAFLLSSKSVADNKIVFLQFILITVIVYALGYVKREQKALFTSSAIISDIALLYILMDSINLGYNYYALASGFALLGTSLAVSVSRKFGEYHFEKILEPVKVILLSLAIYNLVYNFDYTENALFMALIGFIFTIVCVFRKDLLKKLYFIGGVLAVVFSMLENVSEFAPISQGLNIISLAILLFITFRAEDKKFSRCKELIYGLNLLALASISLNTFIHFDLELIGIILLTVVYAILFIASNKNDVFRCFTIVALLLPYIIILPISVWNDNINYILYSLPWLALIFVYTRGFLSSVNLKTVNLIEIIALSIWYLAVSSEIALEVAIFIGIISFVAILIGFRSEKWSSLYYTGVAFLIVNTIFQLKDFWALVPIWAYFLVAGLILIGIVTYKEYSKTNEKEKVQKVEAEVVGAPKPEVVKTPVDTRVILTGSLLYLVFIPIILEIIL